MDSQSVQCKKVYEYFGNAIYWSQCIEQAMIHLIVLLGLFPNAESDPSDKISRDEEYKRFINKERTKTMGRLLGRLQELGIPSENLNDGLKETVIKRNWLAHSYFSDRAMSFVSEAGRLEMIDELKLIKHFFMNIESEISAIYEQVSIKHGLTKEMSDKVMSEMLLEANSDL